MARKKVGQLIFSPPHLLPLLDLGSGMNKNYDPGSTSRIRTTDTQRVNSKGKKICLCRKNSFEKTAFCLFTLQPPSGPVAHAYPEEKKIFLLHSKLLKQIQ
jgi:hypothetical protein